MSNPERPDLDRLDVLERQVALAPWDIETAYDTEEYESDGRYIREDTPYNALRGTMKWSPRATFEIGRIHNTIEGEFIAALRNAAPWLIACARQADTLERTLAWARDAAALIRTYAEADDECRCERDQRCTHCRGAELIERAERLGIAAPTTKATTD